MPSSHLHPPKQNRSRKTLERIVRASLEILEEEGPDALTVGAIVDRADSSVGSFYARFEGKDDLLEYLGERVWSEASERWDESLTRRDWVSMDLRELIEGAVRLLQETHRSGAASLRALDRAGGSGDAFTAFRAHVLDGLEELLLERRDEMGHPDPETAVRLGLRVVSALSDEVARGRWEPDDGSGVERELTRLLRSYLLPGTEQPGKGEGKKVEFFDVWG